MGWGDSGWGADEWGSGGDAVIPPAPGAPRLPRAPGQPRRANSELGTDVACLLDTDPRWSLVTGWPNLGRALARRLSTPRGGLFYDPNYGLDLRGYLHGDLTGPEVAALGAAIAEECEKDERVQRAQVALTYQARTQTLLVNIQIQTASGPFALILRVSELTVEILNAEAA